MEEPWVPPRSSPRHFTLVALTSSAVLVATVSAACAAIGESERATEPRRSTFTLRGPGAALPSGKRCASLVRRSRAEERPQNARANRTTPGRYRIRRIDGADHRGQARLAPRIDGNFKGTTDEIIQWAACKWGYADELVRAVVYTESGWEQATVGDNGHSFGLMQVKAIVHDGTSPWARRSSAFNLDYALAWQRACFEGYFDWVPAEATGDVWSCVALWYTGDWDWAEGRDGYLSAVRKHLAEKPWRGWVTVR